MRIEPGTVEGMEDFFLYVIEDFIPPTYFKFLVSRGMYTSKYGYYSDSAYGNKKLVETQNTQVFDMGQFAFPVMLHGVPVDVEMFSFLEPAIFQIYDTFPEYTFKGVNRAKFNILMCYPECDTNKYNTPHFDVGLPHSNEVVPTALLYIEGTTGDTVIFKERFEPLLERPETFTEFMRITPKPNTLVFFNSTYYHASSNPRTGGARCALNIVFDAERKIGCGGGVI